MNDFYILSDVQHTDGSLSATVSFNAQHAIFAGHFPGQPVVPGVCIMQLVKDVLEQQLNKKLKFLSSGNVKFLRLVTPEISPLLNIKWEQKESSYFANASLIIDGAPMFKMDGKYSG